MDAHQAHDADTSDAVADTEALQTARLIPALHLILQGKGGVGKTWIASLIAQHLKERGYDPICLDTDPVNKSFRSFAALSAEPVSILTDEEEIDVAGLDKCIDTIMSSDRHIVMDNGAASFVPLTSYLTRDGIIEMLTEDGRVVFIHTVIAGGGEQDETVHQARRLIETVPASAKIVMWLNPLRGDIRKSESIINYFSKRLSGVVRIPRLNPRYEGENLRNMLEKWLTFEEALKSTEFTMMERRRLAKVWDGLSRQIGDAIDAG